MPEYLADPEGHLGLVSVDSERFLVRVSSRSRETFGPSTYSIQGGIWPEYLADPERHLARVSGRCKTGIGPEYLIDPERHLARISSRSKVAFGPSI